MYQTSIHPALLYVLPAHTPKKNCIYPEKPNILQSSFMYPNRPPLIPTYHDASHFNPPTIFSSLLSWAHKIFPRTSECKICSSHLYLSTYYPPFKKRQYSSTHTITLQHFCTPRNNLTLIQAGRYTSTHLKPHLALPRHSNKQYTFSTETNTFK